MKIKRTTNRATKRAAAADVLQINNYSFDDVYNTLVQKELTRQGINTPKTLELISCLYAESCGKIKNRDYVLMLNEHLLKTGTFREMTQAARAYYTHVLNAVYFTAWEYAPTAYA